MTSLRWKCFVLAIICAFVVTVSAAPVDQEAENEFDSGIDSAQNSNRLALPDLLLRYKRQQPKCMEVGGYCRYHEDCCSRLCLSFSYKCVSRPHQSEFTPQAGGQGIGAEDVENRFGESGGSDSVASNASRPVCRPAGEYCQRSTDCCSGTCLSFSYKCVGSPLNRPQSQWQGVGAFQPNVYEVGHPIPPINEITIEELVNRFGEENSLTTNNVNLPTTSVSGTTQRVPLSSTSRPIATDERQPQRCITSGGQCQFSNQCCTRLCVQISSNNQFCAEAVPSPPTPLSPVTPSRPISSAPQQCLAIGGKCYNHSECCSGRCHMFLHQCVT